MADNRLYLNDSTKGTTAFLSHESSTFTYNIKVLTHFACAVSFSVKLQHLEKEGSTRTRYLQQVLELVVSMSALETLV